MFAQSCHGFNPMTSQFPNSQFSEYPQAGQQHLIQDLMHDRHRDTRNLSLINDLIDARRFDEDRRMAMLTQLHAQGNPVINQAAKAMNQFNAQSLNPLCNQNYSGRNVQDYGSSNYARDPLTNQCETYRSGFLPVFQQLMASKYPQNYSQLNNTSVFPINFQNQSSQLSPLSGFPSYLQCQTSQCAPLAYTQTLPWLQVREDNIAIDNTIKTLLRDAKYNRRSEEIITNLALGRTH